jgi:hypothetical protein
MSKIIAIPLVFMKLFSGISVTFATHYCEGSVAESKISLSGELASGTNCHNWSPLSSQCILRI